MFVPGAFIITCQTNIEEDVFEDYNVVIIDEILIHLIHTIRKRINISDDTNTKLNTSVFFFLNNPILHKGIQQSE